MNEVKEGGTTEFPNLNKIFSPSEGKALIWNNLNEDGTPKYTDAEKEKYRSEVIRYETEIFPEIYKNTGFLMFLCFEGFLCLF